MIKTKKIIFITIIIIFYSTICNAVIKDSLFATVGNKAITRSDIINEIKIVLIMNGQQYTEENKIRLEAAAVNASIKRKIKEIEIDRYGNLTFNKEDIDRELNRMASKVNVDLLTFKNIFESNKINFSNIIEQVKIELLWNSLIFALYKDRLSINLSSIEEQLQLINNKKEIDEYLISEIIIKTVSTDKIETKVKEIKKKINEEGFGKVAMELSISETSINGGDLGWLRANVISEKFRYKIINTSVGNISEPTLLPQGIVFFKVRDKRKLKRLENENIEDIKNKLIKSEKQKILNMHSLSHYDNVKRSISIKYY